MSKIFSRENSRTFSWSTTLCYLFLIAASTCMALCLLLLIFGQVHAGLVSIIAAVILGAIGAAFEAYPVCRYRYQEYVAKMQREGRRYDN